MNELKTDDVMRALECCGVYYNCNGCPYFHGEPEEDCQYKAMSRALALLREKDAEIERLIAENAVYANGAEKVAENYHRQGRADAITEFAERLKGFYARLNGKTVGGSVEFHINQIEKEMLGELQ